MASEDQRKHNNKLLEVLSIYGNERIIYLEDKLSILGVIAVKIDMDREGVVYIDESDNCAYDVFDFFFTFEEFLGKHYLKRFAVCKEYALKGKFVTWKEFCEIMDGTLDQSLGEI